MIFRVVISEELSTKILLAKETNAKLQQEHGCLPENMRERNIVTAYDGLIDKLLGDGSSAKIFSGRDEDAVERIAVFTYICSEINDHIRKINAKNETL